MPCELPVSCLGRPQISYKHASIGHNSLHVPLLGIFSGLFLCSLILCSLVLYNSKLNLVKGKAKPVQKIPHRKTYFHSNPISLPFNRLPPSSFNRSGIVFLPMHFHKDLLRLTRHGLICKEPTLKEKYAKIGTEIRSQKLKIPQSIS